jgi:hypothetical protein
MDRVAGLRFPVQENVYLYCPVVKSHPTTDLIGTGGFLSSKYGRSRALIIFLLLVSRVIKPEALAARPVMSIKTAKLHCSWRATF